MNMINQSLVLKNRRQAGFSLIEILIVLALIAAIIGLLVTNLDKILGSSKEKVAQAFIVGLDTPLMAYRLDIGNYPSTDEGLNALMRAPAGKEKRWKGPYLKKLAEDPWNNPYQYRFPGVKNPGSYDVWSFGPSGVENENMIGNWGE